MAASQGGHVPLAKFEYSGTFGTTCKGMVTQHKQSELEHLGISSNMSAVTAASWKIDRKGNWKEI